MTKITLSLAPEAAQMILNDPDAFIEFLGNFGIKVQSIEPHTEPVPEEEREDEPDDSMDGDHESALASAGFGTDENYEHNLYDEGGEY